MAGPKISKTAIEVTIDSRGFHTELRKMEAAMNQAMGRMRNASQWAIGAGGTAGIGRDSAGGGGSGGSGRRRGGLFGGYGAFNNPGAFLRGAIPFASLYGIGKLMQDTVSEALMFENQMAKISTLLNNRELPALKQIADSILKIGTSYGLAAKDISEAEYTILSATFGVQDSIQILKESALAAKIGFVDITTAADALTVVMNSYQVGADKARKINEVLFSTVDRGRISYEQLGHSIGRVSSIAAAVGLSFEETAAIISTATRAGIPANEAITGTGMFLKTFLDPTNKALKELQNSRNSSVFGQVQLNPAQLSGEGLIGTLQKLRANYSDEQLASIFGRERGFRVLNTLLRDTSGLIKDLNLNIAGGEESLEAKLKRVADTGVSALDRLKAAWTNFATTVVNEPVIGKILDFMSGHLAPSSMGNRQAEKGNFPIVRDYGAFSLQNIAESYTPYGAARIIRMFWDNAGNRDLGPLNEQVLQNIRGGSTGIGNGVVVINPQDASWAIQNGYADYSDFIDNGKGALLTYRNIKETIQKAKGIQQDVTQITANKSRLAAKSRLFISGATNFITKNVKNIIGGAAAAYRRKELHDVTEKKIFEDTVESSLQLMDQEQSRKDVLDEISILKAKEANATNDEIEKLRIKLQYEKELFQLEKEWTKLASSGESVEVVESTMSALAQLRDLKLRQVDKKKKDLRIVNAFSSFGLPDTGALYRAQKFFGFSDLGSSMDPEKQSAKYLQNIDKNIERGIKVSNVLLIE